LKYKPSDNFSANMQMIHVLLKDTAKEIGGPEGKTSYVLCVVVEPDNKDEGDFVHLHGRGYVKKTLYSQLKVLEGGPQAFKTICFELLADALLITRTDGKQIGIGLKDISEVPEREKYVALHGLINVVANDVDEFILEYAKGFHEKITRKPGTPIVDMKIPKKRRH